MRAIMKEALQNLREAEAILKKNVARRKEAISAVRRAARKEEDAWMNPLSEEDRRRIRERGDLLRMEVDSWCIYVELAAGLARAQKERVEELKRQERVEELERQEAEQ